MIFFQVHDLVPFDFFNANALSILLLHWQHKFWQECEDELALNTTIQLAI